jgi:hypothetical protein
MKTVALLAALLLLQGQPQRVGAIVARRGQRAHSSMTSFSIK